MEWRKVFMAYRVMKKSAIIADAENLQQSFLQLSNEKRGSSVVS